VPTDSTASPSPGCYRLTNERGRAPAHPTPTPGLPVPATGRCPSGRRVKPRPVGDERPFRRRRNPSLDPRSASSFPALASTPSTAASMKVVSVRSRRRIDPTRVWWCRSRRRVERPDGRTSDTGPTADTAILVGLGSALSVYAGMIGSEQVRTVKSCCQRVRCRRCSPDAGPRVATEASEHEPSRRRVSRRWHCNHLRSIVTAVRDRSHQPRLARVRTHLGRAILASHSSHPT
jgi:hypothetical protein